MRGLVVLPIVAACSFQGGSSGTQPIGDARGVVDSVTGSDARAIVTNDGGSPDAHATGCVDANHDGICDSQTWSCGTKPAAPSNPMSLGGASNVAGASLGGDGGFLVAVAGATVTLAYDYGIDVMCGSGTTCPAQIELGLVSGGRQGCLFDGTVHSDLFQGQLGQSISVTVPATSGVYDVRANIGMSSSCASGGTTWYGSEPGAANTIAYICVP